MTSAEKRLEAAKAPLPALEARLKAEARGDGNAGAGECRAISREEARKLERQANYLDGRG